MLTNLPRKLWDKDTAKALCDYRRYQGPWETSPYFEFLNEKNKAFEETIMDEDEKPLQRYAYRSIWSLL